MLTTKTNEQKRPYGTTDIAKESGIKSPAVVRRILRAAAIKKPKDGWSWAPARSRGEAVGNSAAILRWQTRPMASGRTGDQPRLVRVTAGSPHNACPRLPLGPSTSPRVAVAKQSASQQSPDAAPRRAPFSPSRTQQRRSTKRLRGNGSPAGPR